MDSKKMIFAWLPILALLVAVPARGQNAKTIEAGKK